MSLKGHKKSRRGCQRCKSRRCDENRPCSNCIRRNESCSLVSSLDHCPSCQRPWQEASSSSTPAPSPAATPASVADQTPQPVSTPRHDPFVGLAHLVGAPQALGPEDWSLDLLLMHNYSTRTYRLFSSNPAVIDIWQTWIPAQAARSEYAMHGLLGVSALHLAFEHRRASQLPESERFLAAANRHQGLALALFRPILPDINESNYVPVFLFATLTSVFSISIACMGCRLTVREAVETFLLTKGVAEVLEPARKWIGEGPLAQMLSGHSGMDKLLELPLPEETQSRLASLRELVASACADVASRDVCLHALEQLEVAYRGGLSTREGEHLETGRVWKWVVEVKSEYLRMLKEHDPVALVLLAHFAALTALLEDKWFIHGWGRLVLDAVGMVLEERWREWLVWPRRKVEVGFSEERGGKVGPSS